MVNSVLVATARNEGPYFWEWVAWHKMVGFDSIVVFQNDSDDLTHAVLKCLEKIGVVRYYYNDAPPNKHQIRAYQRAAQTAEFQNADWAMALDLDEFLVVKFGDGTLNSLYRALPECDAVYINWKLFGSSGLTEMSDDRLTQRFTYAEDDDRILTRSQGIKTLFRTDKYKRPGVHIPLEIPETGEKKIVNGSGLPMGSFVYDDWRSCDPLRRSLVQVNHYIVKDPQNFILKTSRGRAHQQERGVDKNYWRKFNMNDAKDETALLYQDRLVEQMTALNDASGGELAELTARSYSRHVKRFNEIRSWPDLNDLLKFCHFRNRSPQTSQDA